jgi:exo-beta-1,3-glucanase (GH17 family)
MDNLGAAAAGGGITGIAIGVANANERDSGVQAMRGLPQSLQSGHGTPLGRGRDPIGTDTPDVPEPPHLHQTYQHENPFASSQCPAIPGDMTPRTTPSQSSLRLNDHHQDFYLADQPTYTDNPYQRHSALWDRRIPGGEIHPDEIEDDADDIMPIPNPRRRSILSFGQKSDHSLPAGMAAGSKGVLTPSGGYGVVNAAEKAAWLQEHSTKKRKLRWLFGAVIILALLGIVAGAVIAGLRLTQKNSSASSSQGQSAAQDTSANGVLDINSAEIQSLMGNSNLHRVFPGMDYTPFNAQYPACLTNPPSQNNVTRDLAVLSQLTNTIRLYGTDCNQTDMVLDAIDRLELTDMKVWLAVWLDNNQTTNDRGLAAMYDILNRKGTGPFAGVILGNEVLFRKDMDIGTLETLITNVRSNLTAKSINLQIAVADLGDNWTAALAAVVDVVMSNIHPFFAGVTSQEAAGWTWDFWQNNDVTLTTGTSKKNIISEVGWPSGGGNDCGAGTCTSSTEGSVAGIAEMNTFMDSFVCQSLANGTDYFWSVAQSRRPTSVANSWQVRGFR